MTLTKLFLFAAAASEALAQQFSGSMTYYNPAGGLGKCGNALQDSDYVVSMNPSQYADNLCGAAICVSFNGKTVQGTLQDRCAGCAYGDIDVTPPMFTTVSSLDAGRINMQWSFCNSNPAPPSPSPVKPDPITTTAIQQPVPQQTSIAVPVVTTVAQINPPTTATSAQTTSDIKGASPSSPQPSSANAINQTTTSTTSSASNPSATQGSSNEGGLAANQFAVPLNAPVQWPSIVNPKRPLVKRRCLGN
ncbi:hypothetical protein HDU79_004883 [Rhizoclosmatium sp. JEL0117]|nr:hypothetical protein HDU79_004883 [Rhizoclosmatium sp. JEL0117]